MSREPEEEKRGPQSRADTMNWLIDNFLWKGQLWYIDIEKHCFSSFGCLDVSTVVFACMYMWSIFYIFNFPFLDFCSFNKKRASATACRPAPNMSTCGGPEFQPSCPKPSWCISVLASAKCSNTCGYFRSSSSFGGFGIFFFTASPKMSSSPAAARWIRLVLFPPKVLYFLCSHSITAL